MSELTNDDKDKKLEKTEAPKQASVEEVSDDADELDEYQQPDEAEEQEEATEAANEEEVEPGENRPELSYGKKIEGQMEKRGWDTERVESARDDPARVVETRDTRHTDDGGKMDDPATGYYHKDGGYVVVNDRTNDVVQVSNLKKPDWKDPWD